MKGAAYKKMIQTITNAAQPIIGKPNDYKALLEKIGDARFVLLGEASHGSQEFYQARADISRQLITEKGFMAIAIEGDWPDAYQIHRYLQGAGSKRNWEQALATFKRFPTWMWRNTTLPPFLQWLRAYNDKIEATKFKIGFYGLDLYCLYSSIEAVINYLEKVDKEAAAQARQRYACLHLPEQDPQTYGYLTNIGLKKNCMNEVTRQLLEMEHQTFLSIQQDNSDAEDEYYYAMQNARLVKNAENYYRIMFTSHTGSWNVRDQHMVEMINSIALHLEKRFSKAAKIIVWAHNSHIGDARATEMSEEGKINIGQLLREKYERDAYLIGFSTFHGFVTAASDWNNPAECKFVVPALDGSYEEVFSHLPYENFFLDLHANAELKDYLNISRLQRAIGVIYRPETERESHYYFSRLPYQFDAIIHFNKTAAVQPLDINPEWVKPTQ
jgi:erythromycin esterase-like protein